MSISHLDPHITSTAEEAQLDAPTQDPEESYIRLSSRAVESREQVEGLLNGRFLDMYNLSRETHEQFGFPEGFPSITEAAEVFNPVDFDLASDYQEPALLLCPPGKTSEDLFRAISTHSDVAVRNCPAILNIDDFVRPSDARYRAFIAEAESKIFPINELSGRPLLERLEYKLHSRQSGEWGMSSDLHALLVMQSIVKGELIDKQNFTIFDGEPIVPGHSVSVSSAGPMALNWLVPVGHCRKGQPTIEWFPSNISSKLNLRGRFRRVLGGRSIVDPGGS